MPGPTSPGMFVMRSITLSCFLFLLACGAAGDPLVQSTAAAAGWLRTQTAPDAGTLHAAAEAAALLHDQPLLEWVQQQRGAFANDAWIALLDRQTAAVQPATARQGHAKLHRYLLASLAPPDDPIAAAVLREFLGLELHGYMLTHQLYALRWARERGAKDAVSTERVQQLVQRMRAAFDALPVFSDLYAEQANLLLAFGERLPKSSIERLTQAQHSDGSFRDETSWNLVFDGEAVASVSNPVHTTAQALLALARWKCGESQR